MTVIIGVKVGNRKETATEVQEVLTEFGCSIKTRIGLHNAGENECSTEGIILLEVVSNAEAELLAENLKKIDGIEVQKMKF